MSGVPVLVLVLVLVVAVPAPVPDRVVRTGKRAAWYRATSPILMQHRYTRARTLALCGADGAVSAVDEDTEMVGAGVKRPSSLTLFELEACVVGAGLHAG